MNNNNSPIGVFDSGLGGLTVLKALKKELPKESFIYFGDTAHVPYGNKSKTSILHYSNKIIKFLQNQNVKLIIVACNTASSAVLKQLIKDPGLFNKLNLLMTNSEYGALIDRINFLINNPYIPYLNPFYNVPTPLI